MKRARSNSPSIRRQSDRWVWQVEKLEDRRMLAGMVVANVFGSTLLIEGDNAANDIVIQQIGSAIELTSGVNPTSISVQGNLAAVSSLELRMSGGNDVVKIDSVNGFKNLIAGGDGNALDFEVIDSSFEKLNLRDADAELSVRLENTQFSKGAFIEAGAGDFDAQVIDVEIGTYLTIRRPTDGSAIGFGDIEIRDSSMKSLKITDEYSRNNVQLEQTTIDTSFTLETGRNFLDLDVIGTQIGKSFKVVDPHGFADIAITDGSTVGATTTITSSGTGNTDLRIEDSAFKAVKFTSEVGDSTFTISGNTQINGNVTYKAVDGHSALRMGDASIIVGSLVHRAVGGGDALTLLTEQATVTKTVSAFNQEGVSDVQIVDDTSIGNFKGSGYTKTSNTQYATRDDESLLADIYVPKSDGPHPAVIVVHGGYWRSGTKSGMTSRAKQLADRGYVVMNVNYRLAPADKFPAQIHDVHSAIMWLKANASTYDVDPSKVGVYGYSAGGHLALLSGLTTSSDGLDGPDAGLADSSVKAIVAGAPGTDFRDVELDSTRFSFFLGGTRAELPEVYAMASPAAHIDSADPPTFVFAGSHDTVIDVEKAQQLSSDLESLGVESEFYDVAGKNHLSARKDLSAMMRSQRFLDSHVKR